MSAFHRKKYFVQWTFVLVLFACVWIGWAESTTHILRPSSPAVVDLTVQSEFPAKEHRKKIAAPDTSIELIWPVEDDVNPNDDAGGINIPLPDNIDYHVEYNPITGEYEVVQSVGGKFDYRRATSMDREDFLDFQLDKNVSKYWNKIKKQ